MGTQFPLPKKGAEPPTRGHNPFQFLAHVCCGETAGWIKMPLGTMVGLGPGNIVLDADPEPPQGAQPAKFRRMCVVAKQTAGWIKIPLGTEVGLGPGRIVLHMDQAPLPKRDTPNFRSMSIVAKRSPISATAEHLYLVLVCMYFSFFACLFVVLS